MRFLHTSDWHLGRSLHQLDLGEAQQDFVAAISEVVITEGVDCLLLAGDVFDRAVPPVHSVKLFTQALADLSEYCTVIVIAGNHDSAVRLGYGSPLFRSGIHIVTNVESVGRPISLVKEGVSVRVYPIPFLDPDFARTALASDEEPLARSHESVMSAAMKRVRDDLNTCDEPVTAAIVMAHAFVSGGTHTDSERDISVGGVESIPAQVFSGVDYVALGHLHGPQQLEAPGVVAIRYSGSPLRYSFSEADQIKSVTLFDVTAQGISEPTARLLDQPRGMAVLTGTLAEILDPQQVSDHCEDWVRVVVTDPARPEQLNQRIRDVYPHALSILHQPPALDPIATDLPSSVQHLDPVALSEAFISEVTNAPATDSEAQLLRDVYETVRVEVDR
jgi:DNA repair protein SbcD/Mre11